MYEQAQVPSAGLEGQAGSVSPLPDRGGQDVRVDDETQLPQSCEKWASARKTGRDPTRRQKDRTQWGASAINQILLRIEKQFFGARAIWRKGWPQGKQRKQICLFARPATCNPLAHPYPPLPAWRWRDSWTSPRTQGKPGVGMDITCLNVRQIIDDLAYIGRSNAEALTVLALLIVSFLNYVVYRQPKCSDHSLDSSSVSRG